MFFKAAVVHSKYNAARLDRLKAETLELHCLKSDLTMMFSIIWGFVDIDCNSLFHVINCESVHTRSRNLRLYKEHCNVNCRLNAFVCRNINVWNRLPAHVMNSDSVAVFKRRLACVNLVNFCSSGSYYSCLKCNVCVLHVFIFIFMRLQCFDAVGWAAGRASGL